MVEVPDMDLAEEVRELNVLRRLLIPSGVLAGWIGCAYLFGADARTVTPSFNTARTLAPMEAWGCLFLVGAITLLIAAVMARRKAIALALFAGGIIYSWWASLFLLTVFTDAHASLVAPALYYFIAFAHFAGAWRLHTRQFNA